MAKRSVPRIVLTYLRKAEGFASNLKRAGTFALEEVTTRYEKNGRYLMRDAEGLDLPPGFVQVRIRQISLTLSWV